MKNSFLIIGLLFLVNTLNGQSSIYGKVTDEKTGEELLYANIVLNKNGVFSTGGSTDFDGNYSIPLDPGTYEIQISYTGYPDRVITGVIIKGGQGTKLDIVLSEKLNTKNIPIVDYQVPIIEKESTNSFGTLTSEQIRNLPTKSCDVLAVSTLGLLKKDEGGNSTVNSNKQNINYYKEGIRVSGNLIPIPEKEMGSLKTITPLKDSLGRKNN